MAEVAERMTKYQEKPMTEEKQTADQKNYGVTFGVDAAKKQ